MLLRRGFSIAVATTLLMPAAWAQQIVSPVPGKRVALRGYDPVAYFLDGRPVQGVPQFWYEFDDTVYFFSSSEHRAVFLADPDQYAPQYRGLCALSVSIGGHDEGDGGVAGSWEIVNGKLFVFSGSAGVRDFATDPSGIIARGKTNWAAAHPK